MISCFRRYKILNELPAEVSRDLEQPVRVHALVPPNPEQNESKATGWCNATDSARLDLRLPDFQVGDYLFLGLRMDAIKVPPSVLKQAVKAEQRRLEAEYKRPLSGGGLREIKELTAMLLRKRAFPVVKSVNMLWDLSKSRLYFGSVGSKETSQEFFKLFCETFKVPLDIEGITWLVRRHYGSHQKIPALRPTQELVLGFHHLRPDVNEREPGGGVGTPSAPDDYSFLGREFLSWLLYALNQENKPKFNDEFGEFEIDLGTHVTLRAANSETVTLKGVAASTGMDVRFVLAGAHTVRQLDLLFKRGDKLWIATLHSDCLDVTKIKCPSLVEDEPEMRMVESCALISELDGMVRSSFFHFLSMREKKSAWSDAVSDMAEWISQAVK